MNVKAVIKEHGYTLTECAEKIGISRITLMQNLQRNPTHKTLQRIADAIGCEVGEFFKDETPTPQVIDLDSTYVVINGKKYKLVPVKE